MRIAISILAFLTGLGCIAYSYIGSVVSLAGEAERSASGGDEVGALAMIIDFILRGEIPQLTGYLYGGALLIVLAVVNLLLANRKERTTEDQD